MSGTVAEGTALERLHYMNSIGAIALYIIYKGVAAANGIGIKRAGLTGPAAVNIITSGDDQPTATATFPPAFGFLLNIQAQIREIATPIGNTST